MKKIHIFNPKAGTGHAPSLLTEHEQLRDAYYITQGVGDAGRYIEQVCRTDPDTHFIVYGGDGTLNEAVSGVLRAGCGDRAILSVVPMGTGNDFVRTLNSYGEKGDVITVDALRVDDGFGVNIINTGFDCTVVDKTQHYKTLPMVGGGAAYVLGVADVLCHKLGRHWELTLTDAQDNIELFDEDGLLALFANGRYYGGGFCAAPLADLTDGLMDVLLVRRVTRLQFLGLVGAYRKGEHLDPVTGAVRERFASFVEYRRCKRASIRGLDRLCSDGETADRTESEIEVLPAAIRMQIL